MNQIIQIPETQNNININNETNQINPIQIERNPLLIQIQINQNENKANKMNKQNKEKTNQEINLIQKLTNNEQKQKQDNQNKTIKIQKENKKEVIHMVLITIRIKKFKRIQKRNKSMNMMIQINREKDHQVLKMR